MKTPTMLICPACGSRDTAGHGRYETVHNGIRSLRACAACGKVFSETAGTPMQCIKTPISKVAAVRLGIVTAPVSLKAILMMQKTA